MTDTQPAAVEVVASTPAGDRLIKLGEVCRTVGLGKTSIYRLVKSGRFPQPVTISTDDDVAAGGIRSSRVRWSANEIQDWIAARLETRK